MTGLRILKHIPNIDTRVSWVPNPLDNSAQQINTETQGLGASLPSEP